MINFVFILPVLFYSHCFGSLIPGLDTFHRLRLSILDCFIDNENNFGDLGMRSNWILAIIDRFNCVMKGVAYYLEVDNSSDDLKSEKIRQP
jgi:hypothetical protein